MSEQVSIEAIRDAFQRMHRVASGQSTESYMSIPANPQRDADMILSAAIDELETLRAKVAELERELERQRKHNAVLDEKLRQQGEALRRKEAALYGFHSRVAELERELESLRAEHQCCLDGDEGWAEIWKRRALGLRSDKSVLGRENLMLRAIADAARERPWLLPAEIRAALEAYDEASE